MDKELALAIDFNKAPVELQAAATAHYANVKAVEKLKANIASKQLELQAAEEAYAKTERVLKHAIKSWEPVV